MDFGHIRFLVSQNKLEKAFQAIRENAIENKYFKNNFDLLSREFMGQNENRILGKESTEIELNKFTSRFLQLLSDYEKEQLNEGFNSLDFLTNQRITKLKKKLEQLSQLQSDWEEKRDLSQNPTERSRCENEINRISISSEKYFKEYKTLIQKVKS